MLTKYSYDSSDGRLRENDQILAINNQVLDTSISHNHAIQILQQARGPVQLVVARDVAPSPPPSTAPLPPESPPFEAATVQAEVNVTDGSQAQTVKDGDVSERKSPLRSESAAEMVVSARTWHLLYILIQLCYVLPC